MEILKRSKFLARIKLQDTVTQQLENVTLSSITKSLQKNANFISLEEPTTNEQSSPRFILKTDSTLRTMKRMDE